MFHNSNVFGSCYVHILYTGCAKIKKNNSGAKGLRDVAAGSGRGVFCNVGIVLTCGAMLTQVSIFFADVLCGIPADCPTSISIVDER